MTQSYHFIGIGGAGMSAIARIMLQSGYRISGSDLQDTTVTRRLARMGARVFKGHDRRNIEGADVVVVSSAVPPANEELQHAKELGIPIVHRVDMLVRLMDGKKGIVVAGTHGKTTTTSMIGIILERAGLDPTLIVGGEVDDIGGNAKLGSGEFVVAEADESDGSFLRLRPFVSVVTNVDDDHLDHYGDMESVMNAFKGFVSLTHPNGFTVLCADGGWREALRESCPSRVLTYGMGDKNHVTCRDLTFNGAGSSFVAIAGGRELGQVELVVPGGHNVLNALAAIAVCAELGVGFDDIKRSLARFTGVHRRFQTLGEVGGVWVVDDYAHHPTEIRATLEAARKLARGRLICVFQPHRYSRTKRLFAEFARSFTKADELIVTEIYPAGEQPIEGVSGRLIVDSAVAQGYDTARFMVELDRISEELVTRVRPGDLVLFVGAGNVWTAGVELVRQLQKAGSRDIQSRSVRIGGLSTDEGGEEGECGCITNSI